MAAITTSPGHHEEVDPNVSYLDVQKGFMSWLVTLRVALRALAAAGLLLQSESTDPDQGAV